MLGLGVGMVVGRGRGVVGKGGGGARRFTFSRERRRGWIWKGGCVAVRGLTVIKSPYYKVDIRKTLITVIGGGIA